MAPIGLIAVSGQRDRLHSLPARLFDRALAKPFRTVALRECLRALLAGDAGGAGGAEELSMA